jgi:hypothetical protein
MDISAANLLQAPPAPRRDYLFFKKALNFPSRGGLQFPLGVLRDETRRNRFDKVQTSRDKRGGPSRFLLGAGIDTSRNFVLGFDRPFPDRLKAGRADREFARFAGNSISDTRTSFAARLNNMIESADAPVWDFSPLRTGL